MSSKIALEKFELHSVVLNSKRGLDITFYDLDFTDKSKGEKSNKKPSIDFYNAMNKLKEVLAYSLGYHNGWNFARENNRKNKEALEKSMVFWKDEIETFSIKQVNLMGVNKYQGIKIKGQRKTELGSVPVESPLIRFDTDIKDSNDESIMLGDLAEVAFKEIQFEVYHYCMTSKVDGEFHFTEAEEKKEGDIIKPSVFE